MTDEVRKLLGGYATGTLTDEEKQVLYDAALHDDQLFEALADEQALKDVLDDPAFRAQALQAAETHRFTLLGSLREWFDRPRAKVLVAAGAVAVVAISIQTVRQHPQALQVAEYSEKVTAPAPMPVQPPAPEPGQVTRVAPKRMQPERQTSKPETLARSTTLRDETAKVAEAAPTLSADATAGAPKPPAETPEPQRVPEPLARTATSGKTQLKYSLAKRAATGELQPVSFDSPITAEDQPQLIVESNEKGFAVLMAGNNRTYWTPVEPARRASLPVPPDAETVTLSFTHEPRLLVGNTLITTRMQKTAEREKTEARAAAPAAQQGFATQAVPEPLISVEIKINRK